MIQQETVLKVIDNSGAKFVKCIKVLGGLKRKFAFLGDVIIVSVKIVKKFSKIKKGEIFKAIIVRTKEKIRKKDGSCISLNENSVSLISKKGRTTIPAASRIFGYIPKKISIKYSDFTKIATGTI